MAAAVAQKKNPRSDAVSADAGIPEKLGLQNYTRRQTINVRPNTIER
jgi:hypothetical protein